MIETSVAFVSLIGDDILRIEYKPDVYVDLPQFEENMQAYRKLMKTDRVFLLTLVHTGAEMSLEVRNQFSSAERSAFKISEAFVITTLAHKIVANFIMKLQKPHHKVAVFSSEASALAWLKEEREEYYKKWGKTN
jgi:hypothetical protein